MLIKWILRICSWRPIVRVSIFYFSKDSFFFCIKYKYHLTEEPHLVLIFKYRAHDRYITNSITTWLVIPNILFLFWFQNRNLIGWNCCLELRIASLEHRDPEASQRTLQILGWQLSYNQKMDQSVSTSVKS